MKVSVAKVPKFESIAAKRFWKDVIGGWQVDVDELRLLEQACRDLDDAEACRATLKASGRFTVNRYGGQVEHPALAAGLKARAQFAVKVRQLGLHADETKKPMGRPPRTWSSVELRDGELQ